MEINEFIEKFVEAIECESPENITAETKFRDLEEWSSLATLSVIALADEEYGVELGANEMRQANTIQDLFDIISSKV